MSILETTRLNAAIRYQIKHAAMNHRFLPLAKQIEKDGARLAAVIYAENFSAEHRDLMASLPVGWLEEARSIHFKWGGGMSGYLYFNGEIKIDWKYRENGVSRFLNSGFRAEAKRRMPFQSKGDRNHYIKNVELNAQIKTYYAQVESLCQEFMTASKTIDAALKSYTTVKTLKLAWPEVEPFLPKTQEQINTTPNLPAISFPTLNAMFKLPVPKEQKLETDR
jgi:hypothetical protein